MLFTVMANVVFNVCGGLWRFFGRGGVLLEQGGEVSRSVAETVRGFPWLLPHLQGVHVLQQAQNTLFPRIVFADFIAWS